MYFRKAITVQEFSFQNEEDIMDLTEFMSCLRRFQREHPEQVMIFENENHATIFALDDIKEVRVNEHGALVLDFV